MIANHVIFLHMKFALYDKISYYKKMDRNQFKRTALVYDFDGTLARGNLQERSFIPDIVGMESKVFWKEVKDRAQKHDADEVLVYMYMMIEKSQKRDIKITKKILHNHGQKAELFSGLADRSWFVRINQHAAKQGLMLEHYIISSGIYEMIEGCPIRSDFKQVFASKFIYENGIAKWPGAGINYTNKTQYLFRINKGIGNYWDNKNINRYMPENKRPIPFERMIFLGDGLTDIPTMKMLTYKGGYSVAVYDPQKGRHDINKILELISDRRVNFTAPANYMENSQLDIITRGILGRIARHANSSK